MLVSYRQECYKHRKPGCRQKHFVPDAVVFAEQEVISAWVVIVTGVVSMGTVSTVAVPLHADDDISDEVTSVTAETRRCYLKTMAYHTFFLSKYI